MIVCRKCGNSAPSGDDFCPSCGSLLEWSGERVEVGPGPAPRPEASVAADPGAPTAVGPDPAVGPADPVAARKPDAEASRPDPQPLVVEPVYTGPFCSDCGVRNPEGRTYCRSCGARLRVEVVVESRPSWWRRLLRRLSGRRTYAAGERPRGFRRNESSTGPSGRRRFRLPRRVTVSRFAPVLVVLGLAGVGLGPMREWITHQAYRLVGRASDKVHERYVGVAPVGATGTRAGAGHGAGLAVDGVRDTYFATPGTGGGAGASLTVRFAEPSDIDRIGFLSGAPGADFRVDARPRAVQVTVDGAEPVRLNLDDTGDFQNQAVHLRGVRSVTLVVTEVYPGQKNHAVALREVQFFERSR